MVSVNSVCNVTHRAICEENKIKDTLFCAVNVKIPCNTFCYSLSVLMHGLTFSFISYKIKVLLFVYFHVNFNYTHFILIKKKYKHFILKLAKKKKEKSF